MTSILTDVPFIAAATVMVAVAVLTGTLVINEMDQQTNSSQMNQEILDEGRQAYQVFDLGLVAFNIFFWIVGIILGLMTRSHPVFAIPSIIVLAVSGFISMQLSNVYAAIASSSGFASTANQFPAFAAFMSNYGSVTLVLGAVVIVMLFGKRRSRRDVAV